MGSEKTRSVYALDNPKERRVYPLDCRGSWLNGNRNNPFECEGPSVHLLVVSLNVSKRGVDDFGPYVFAIRY